MLLGLGLVAAVVLGQRSCDHREEIELPLVGAGVTINRLLPSVGSNSTDTEWVMEAGGLQVIVQGEREGRGRASRGRLLAVKPAPGQAGPLRSLETLLFVAGKELALETIRVAPEATEQAPVLRVEQRESVNSLTLTTTMTVAPGRPWVEVVTQIRNDGKRRLAMVAPADRLQWPGAATFAPRLGAVDEPTTVSAPWIARLGHRYGYALAFPDGPAEVSFEFDRVGPTSQTAVGSAVELGPGEVHQYRRLLIVVRGGMAELAELAWPAVSRAVGRVEGRLEPAPSWAVIRALHPDGQPILEVSADSSGSYVLPLPEGTYRLLLECPGGLDQQTVIVDPKSGPVEASLIAPSPGRLRLSAVDTEEHPLPVRWLIRGVPPTPNPDFGPDERVEGAKNAVYSMTGSGDVELAPGKYKVLASHGMEWSVDEHEVEIRLDAGRAVHSVLSRQVLTPGWVSGDFHVHAAPSPDSSVVLEDRVTALVAEGVEFAAATDHNHVTDYAEAVASVQASDRIVSVSGVEVTVKDWGHFNAYPYPVGAGAPPFAEMSAEQIFAGVRGRAPNAMLQVNHPHMKDIGYFNRGGLNVGRGVFTKSGFDLSFDALEVVNGFELDEPETLDSNLRDWFGLLNRGYRYTAVGNSDSHRLVFQWAGYPRTYVRVVEDDPSRLNSDAVIEALRAGHAIVSAGPFVTTLVDGVAGPGDQLSVGASIPILEVSVRAADWVDVTRAEVWINGSVFAQRRASSRRRSPARIQWQLPLELTGDSWVVVVVRGSELLDRVVPGLRATPIAFTNPVFIDVDGDQIWTPPIDHKIHFDDRPHLDHGEDSMEGADEE